MAISATELDRLSAIVAQDPELTGLLQNFQTDMRRDASGKAIHPARGGISRAQGGIERRLQALGVDTSQMKLDHDEQGRPFIREKTWLEKHGSKLPAIAAGAITGGLVLPAVLPGAAAAAGTGGATAAGTGGATAAGTGATAAGTGATVAGAGGGMFAAIDKVLPYIDAAGRLSQAAGVQRSNNRAAAADAAVATDLANARRAQAQNDQIRLDLDQRRYLDESEERNANNAVAASLLRGLQDVNIGAPSQVPRANITGGLRPSAIGDRDEIGRVMYQTSMERLLDPMGAGGIEQADGTRVGAGSGDRNLPSIPYLPPVSAVPQPGGLDTALGLIDLAGAGIGFLSDQRRNAASTPLTQPGGTVYPNAPVNPNKVRPEDKARPLVWGNPKVSTLPNVKIR